MNVRGAALILASLSTHALVAAGVLAIPVRETHAPTAITIRESKPKSREAPKPQVEAAPEKTERTTARAKTAPAKSTPKSTETRASTPAATGGGELLDLGLLPGGDGPGLAVGAQGATAPAPSSPARNTEPAKVNRRPAATDDCDEPLQKPVVEVLPQPVYNEKAREGAVQGKVRITIQVDERGGVTGASLLSGLGFGLDEAALEAARRAKFKPATRCGKPVAAPFVVAMRFAL